MTFPLRSSPNATSLLSRLPRAIRHFEKPPSLSLVLQAITDLSRLTGLNLGLVRELKPTLAFLIKDQLSVEDHNAQRAFAEFILEGKDRDWSNATLEGCLADRLKGEMPPFEDLIKTLSRCVSITGLLSGELYEWDRILRRHYPHELEKGDRILWRGLCGFFRNNLLRMQTPKQEKNFIRELVKCQKEQLKGIAEVLFHTWQVRRSAVMKSAMASINSKERAKELQRICNALLRENYLLGEIDCMLAQMKRNFCFIDCSANGKIAAKLRERESTETTQSLEELSIALRVEVKVDKIAAHIGNRQRRFRPQKSLCSLERPAETFEQLDDILAFIDAVAAKEKALNRHDIMQGIEKRRDYIRSLKCQFSCENFIARFFDLHFCLGLNIDTPPSEHDLQISPLSAAIWAFLVKNSNPETEEADIFESIEFLAKIGSIYRDTQKRQNAIYSLALSELCQVGREIKKNEMLSFVKISPPFLHHQGVLPQKLQMHFARSERSALLKSPHVDAPISKAPVCALANQTLIPKKEREHRAEPSVYSNDRLKAISAKPFPFQYDQRVTRWYSAKVPLNSLAFPEYAHSPQHLQKKMIALHSFSSLADCFLNDAIEFHHPKKCGGTTLLRYLLPAEFTVYGETIRGCIVWAIDERKICYHRFFHIKPMHECCEKAIRRTFSDADFPDLMRVQRSQDRQKSTHSPLFIESEPTTETEFDDLLGIVKLRDLRLGHLLKLFLVNYENTRSIAKQI